MKKQSLLATAFVAMLLYSCKTPNVGYISDVKNGPTDAIAQVLDIRFKPDDKICIIIKSQDSRLSELFNLPIYTLRVGWGNSSSQYMSAYTIDPDGNIDFPVLGTMHLAGMSRHEVEQFVKNELLTRKLVNDPHVRG